MDLNKLSKTKLLVKCEECGFTKYKSKNKTELIELINSKFNIKTEQLTVSLPQTELLICENNMVVENVVIENMVVENVVIENTVVKNTSVYNTPLIKLSHHLKPLVKWSGGKSDEIKMFEQYFPQKYEKYIEPFVGGGSVFFHLNPVSAVISDVHIELIDLYSSIGKGKSPEIYEFMQNSPNDETTYYQIRDKMEIANELDRAKRFYYQRKTCFRGMLRYNRNGKFNIPFGRYKTINYSDLLNPHYEALLSRTEILNKGFEYMFENYNDENNFMFLDPPYDSEFTDYGYCQFGKEEQKKLAELFKTTKIKCLMIIGKTSFIEELYNGYIVSEYDKRYRFKLYANRIGDEINTQHLIIKNY
jgi:DNA adenine methylase